MSNIKIGNLNISKIYLGTGEVSKIYFGASEVYSSGPGPLAAKRCVVANLGSRDPTDVTFTKSANFPTESNLWEEVTIGSDKFAKFTPWYRKTVYNANNELTGFIISDQQEDADFHPYDCFLDENGNLLPYILIGRYCVSDSNTANSVDAARVTMTIDTGRTICQAKGTGYQQMDIAMQMFWRDLALACSETVNFNNGLGVASYLGLARMTDGGWWIDGCFHIDTDLYVSNKPSKYAGSSSSNPTSSQDGYEELSYNIPNNEGYITKLGYDANHPTINVPTVVGGSASTYYCDYYFILNGNRPCAVHVGGSSSDATRGLFSFLGTLNWSSAYGVRLAYKPPYTPSQPSVDAILGNNSWDTIKSVCEAGDAANYWALGDTKTDTGTDSKSRTMRICDMQGLYGKHVVFEQVEQESTTQVWNPSSNTDGDSCYNNYSITNVSGSIRYRLNNTYNALLSSELQGALTDTSVQVATNGNNGTLLTVTDKIFLPAEKEIFGSQTYSRSEEAAALSQYQYYATHNTANDRKKLRDGTAKYWWLRSPYSGRTRHVCLVDDFGDAGSNGAGDAYGVAPCFAF